MWAGHYERAYVVGNKIQRKEISRCGPDPAMSEYAGIREKVGDVPISRQHVLRVRKWDVRKFDFMLFLSKPQQSNRDGKSDVQ